MHPPQQQWSGSLEGCTTPHCSSWPPCTMHFHVLLIIVTNANSTHAHNTFTSEKKFFGTSSAKDCVLSNLLLVCIQMLWATSAHSSGGQLHNHIVHGALDKTLQAAPATAVADKYQAGGVQPPAAAPHISWSPGGGHPLHRNGSTWDLGWGGGRTFFSSSTILWMAGGWTTPNRYPQISLNHKSKVWHEPFPANSAKQQIQSST